MPKTSDVGVIVGRFQVHRLHEAHEALIRSVYDTHRQTLIVLGLSPTRVTMHNPLDFEARKQMLLDAFPKATVLYIKDEPLDANWSKKLDALIADYTTPAQTVCLYGGRDSFVAHYSGTHRVEVLEPELYVSGTELRRSISKGVKATEDFRAGVIWASANGYPRAYPTVDIAVRKADVLRHSEEWLFVQKPNEKLWRLPGGFVSPTDVSLEMAARRELLEETGIEVDGLTYVASMIVDDWRYRGEADKIMTTLFRATYVHGPLRPADDVAHARWFTEIDPREIVEEHRPLWIQIQGGR